MGDSSVVERVRQMVAPLVESMQLDLYDLEFRGGVLRVTIDTPVGSTGGVDIDTISLVTRMISRDFDHDDPMPGRYTLEVTSPGLERTLRTPAHFQRELGKTVALRLRDTAGDDRRVHGTLLAASDTEATVRLDDAAQTERVVPYAQIDRAKTVFVWGPAPKPGKQPSSRAGAKSAKPTRSAKPARSATAATAAGTTSAESDPSVPTPTPQEAS